MPEMTRALLLGALALLLGSAAAAAPLFVGDRAGPSALPDAIVRFESADGSRSELATGTPLWTEARDLDALPGDDVVVLDMGGPSVAEPRGLFRFDGADGTRSPITTASGPWIDPLAMAIGPDGDVIILDRGGPMVAELPALLRFDGSTGARSVLAEGLRGAKRSARRS